VDFIIYKFLEINLEMAFSNTCCLYQLGDGFQTPSLAPQLKPLKAIKAMSQLKTT